MRFNYADGRLPISMLRGGNTYYMMYDQVGSLRLIVDSTGNTVKRIDYDSFGNIISDTNPGFTIPFGFAGGLHDRETGLVRFGARDFDPTIGRWTAKDPIDFTGGDVNLYGYVQNNPVNFIDPYGLYTWPYTWKGWAGVTFGLAGLAVAPVSLPIGGILIGASIVFSVWDTVEGPIQVEKDFKENVEQPLLQPYFEDLDELDKLLDKDSCDKGGK